MRIIVDMIEFCKMKCLTGIRYQSPDIIYGSRSTAVQELAYTLQMDLLISKLAWNGLGY
jgi:hypothetical protein